jgi:hypothetical protein
MPDTRYTPYDWRYPVDDGGFYYLAGLRFEGFTLVLAGRDDAERVAAIDRLTAELAKLRESAVDRIGFAEQTATRFREIVDAPGAVLP